MIKLSFSKGFTMRNKSLQALCLLVFLSFNLGLSACADTSAALKAESNLVQIISTAEAGKVHAFKVDIADDEAERETGLMYRQNLNSDQGMLFLFPDVAERSFWMKNTVIPLDIIYISPTGSIVSIQKNAIPQDLTPLRSFGAAVAVLEVKGGLSDQLGIKPGDKVRHPFFEGKGPKPQ
jgi:uncharacterized protein